MNGYDSNLVADGHRRCAESLGESDGGTPLARLAIQRDEFPSRNQTGGPIETRKSSFDSSLREEVDKIGKAWLCIK